MKKKALITGIILIVFQISVSAQNDSSKILNKNYNHVALGFHLNDFQNDFGLGFSITSPYFVQKRIALKGSYNIAFRDGMIQSESVNSWNNYSSMQFGLVGVAGMIGESIRIYGGGGIIVLLPNSTFSSEASEIGGYGLWGFEFIFSPRISYSLELGGIGIGSKADKMIGEPKYSNGFSTSVGIRFYF